MAEGSSPRGDSLAKWSAGLGLGLVAAAVGAYLPAWLDLFREAAVLWQSADGSAGAPPREEVVAALQFWTFFAAMHPLLSPVLWLSEVTAAAGSRRAPGAGSPLAMRCAGSCCTRRRVPSWD